MRTHPLRSYLAVVVFFVVTTGPSTAIDADDGAIATPPAVEFVDMPAEFTGAATWAMDLFDQAGFELPPIRYVFHGDAPERCSGRAGKHHRVEGVSVIEICTADLSFPAQRMVLHETAHAWIDHTVTDERRASFQQLRGWTYWRDYDAAAWHENGTEQAAEIMVWGLIDRPLAMVRIDQNSCDELDAGYRALTGQAPLHGFRDAC
jgi:hypothetical protein